MINNKWKQLKRSKRWRRGGSCRSTRVKVGSRKIHSSFYRWFLVVVVVYCLTVGGFCISLTWHEDGDDNFAGITLSKSDYECKKLKSQQVQSCAISLCKITFENSSPDMLHSGLVLLLHCIKFLLQFNTIFPENEWNY